MSYLTLRSFVITVCVLMLVCSSFAYSAANSAAGKEKSATCQGCHGTDGNSYAGNWPNLAGQHSRYIRKQIQNFQSGDRQDPTMTSMVKGLSQTDIADIAAYFSSQTIKPVETTAGANLIALGRKIYKGGNRYSGVPACAGCHGPNGAGISPSAFPVLSGQKIDYTKKALNDFRADIRQNDPHSIMRNIAGRLTDKEIHSVATYISTLSQ